MNRRCVIFAGLAVPPHLCQDIGPQDVILAADAGWKTARALGFAPTLALGDFDTARKYYRKLIEEYPTDIRMYGAKQALKRMDEVEGKIRGEM